MSLLIDAHLSQLIMSKDLHPLLQVIQKKSKEEANADFKVTMNFPAEKKVGTLGGNRYARMLEDVSNTRMYEIVVMNI